MSIVTIATDFGTSDGYVAVMKGIIRSIAESAEIIDVTHDLGSIEKASLVLSRYYLYYPESAIHMVIVDPGVGSLREPLIGYADNHYFVGPDNGVFSRIINRKIEQKWWKILPSKLGGVKVSDTFHGRDIFAPAAALLARGTAIDSIGSEFKKPVSLDMPVPLVSDDRIEGEIIDIDKFGNLITNIPSEMITAKPRITIAGRAEIGLFHAYSDVDPGKPLAYIGSMGLLEIGVNQGRADSYFKLDIGGKVRIES